MVVRSELLGFCEIVEQKCSLVRFMISISNCFKFSFFQSNLSRHITLGRSLRFPYHDIEADVVREGAPLHAVGAEHDYPRYKSWIKIRSEKLFKIVSIVLSSRVCVLIGMNWIFCQISGVFGRIFVHKYIRYQAFAGYPANWIFCTLLLSTLKP